MKKLYTVTELAKETGYTRQGIFWQINRGNIKPVLRNPIVLFEESEFKRILEIAEQGKRRSFKRIKHKG